MRSFVKIIHMLYRRYVGRPLNQLHCYDFPSSNNDWLKDGKVPVWGNRDTGTMFDPYAFIDGNKFMLVVSSRKDNRLILLNSLDGKNWTKQLSLIEGMAKKWDEMVNRGCLLCIGNQYFLWYTGQTNGKSSIGLAISDNGLFAFSRISEHPVLETTLPHEGVSVMNPCVLWDDEMKLFRMWYSAGETYEPDIICYAESEDGVHWNKHPYPVLTKYTRHKWEQYKVGGCQVVRQSDDTFLMYYIGYQNIDVARICIAHSKDGINWERDDHNLLIAPSKGSWDADATYKPTVVEKDGRLYMWYNGRKAHEEYIGLATKKIK